MADFDNIRSKQNTKEYEDNYDRIFRKPEKECCGSCSNHDKESSVLEDAKEKK